MRIAPLFARFFLPAAAWVLLGPAAPAWAQIGRVLVKPEAAKSEYGKALHISITIENTGTQDLAWRVPSPPYEIREKGRLGAPAVRQEAPSEIIPCVAVGRCESVRLSTGRKASFEVDLTPSEDLGISAGGLHDIEVRVRAFVFPKGGGLAREEWIAGGFRIDMAGAVNDVVYTCPDHDARLRFDLKAAPAQGAQEEIRLQAVLTNISGGPLELPRRLGCPNVYESLRLFPPGYRGHLEEVSGVYGVGAPMACPAEAPEDFVATADGEKVEIPLDIDPLTFPLVAAGPYEATATVRNDLPGPAEDQNSRSRTSRWVGCLRSHSVSLEITPPRGTHAREYPPGG